MITRVTIRFDHDDGPDIEHVIEATGGGIDVGGNAHYDVRELPAEAGDTWVRREFTGHADYQLHLAGQLVMRAGELAQP